MKYFGLGCLAGLGFTQGIIGYCGTPVRPIIPILLAIGIMCYIVGDNIFPRKPLTSEKFPLK